MKIKSNAKINLFLDVLGKRKDGYHNIKTVFQEVSLSDDIFLTDTEKHANIKVFCDNTSIPTDKNNLAYKAADLIKRCFKIENGVEIRIKKNIPVGAGLGGGSSNAAAILLGLNKLWKLELSKTQLVKIGKQLGADVPFFIHGGRCLGERIGDKLTPIKVGKTQWYVIVKPPYQISTKSVYEHLTKLRKNNRMSERYNALESVVIPLYPEIKRIKDRLVESGAIFSLMSGSGSCVFGLAKNKTTGKRIKNCLAGDGYAVWLVRSVIGRKLRRYYGNYRSSGFSERRGTA